MAIYGYLGTPNSTYMVEFMNCEPKREKTSFNDAKFECPKLFLSK
jgi:hypothetical protein